MAPTDLGIFQVEEVAPGCVQGLDGELVGTQEECCLHHVWGRGGGGDDGSCVSQSRI